MGFRNDPEKVYLSKKTRTALEQLSDRYPVAVISGRSLENIADKTRGMKLHLGGNHGFEIRLADGVSQLQGKAGWRLATRKWERATKKFIKTYPELYGSQIELKSFSLAVHFREVKDPAAAAKLYEKLISGVTPRPRLVGGRLVMNVLPVKAYDKADCLEFLMKKLKCKSAVFAGDDITDEDVFCRDLPNVVTIRVGGSNLKIPATFHLKSRSDLRSLIELLSRS